MARTAAIIPAGGKGVRTGFKIPKQFLKINGVELISYTIEIFQQCKEINDIFIAAPEEYFHLLERCRIKYKFTKLKGVIRGGKERQDSVYNILNAVNFNDDDLIAVHDAARPLLAQNLLKKVIVDAKKYGNAVLAVNARDTLATGNGKIESYADRLNVYYIQTPQVFRFSELKSAFDKAYEENFTGTDESMLVKRLGHDVHLTEGSHLNFKITTPEDIKLFKKLVTAKS